MKKSEIQSLIYEGLGEILSHTDFRLKKSEGGFVRKIPQGRQALVVSLIDYKPKFIFSLTACIRLDEVENILHQFSGSPAKCHSMSYTTMTQLEYFTGITPSEFSVTTEAEVSSALGGLAGIVEEKIVPCFDECQDVRALNQMVNSDPANGVPFDSTQPPWGAAHAIIVARLAEHGDLDQLIAKYRSKWNLGDDPHYSYNRIAEFVRAL